MHAWDALRRPIWLFDPEGLRGVYANPAALALWGADSLDELLSRDFSVLSPAVRARTQRLALATVAGDTVKEQWTFYPHGQPVTVEATISTYRLADGRDVLLFEAAQSDVGAGERRAVEALRHASTLITLFDEAGGALFANPAAFAAYGSAEHAFTARFTDPALGAALLGRAVAGETLAEVCEIQTVAGQRWHHLDARPALDPVTGATGVLLNETDVTARVEAERGRAAAEQKAAMAEARRKFLTDMSHELRTPLNAVIGFSGLLSAADLAPESSGQAGRIHAAGKRLLSVVNEMIRLAEVDGWSGEAATPSVEPPPPQADSPPDALRVLYVDDNESNRTLVAAILQAQGIDCRTVNDGAQGLEAAREGGWDVILMDIQMPVMNGVEATRAIRALAGPPGVVPILAVTANTLDAQLKSYAEAGLDDCIPKPVQMAELIAKVAAWSQAIRAFDGEGQAA